MGGSEGFLGALSSVGGASIWLALSSGQIELAESGKLANIAVNMSAVSSSAMFVVPGAVWSCMRLIQYAAIACDGGLLDAAAERASHV